MSYHAAPQVLLTNPPYSGAHKERLYRYILDAQRAAVQAGAAAPPEAIVPHAPFLLLCVTTHKPCYQMQVKSLGSPRN